MTWDDIDEHLGKRVRHRRRLLGLTQQRLAIAVGVRFQQIQKYEWGKNKISAARLWAIAQALEVPVAYFYDGLTCKARPQASEVREPTSEETSDLIQAYYKLAERPRRRLLDLAISLQNDPDEASRGLSALERSL